MHRLEAEGAHQPDRSPLHETADILPPDEGHVIAESLFVMFEQAMAMPVFFAAEFFELLRLLRVILLQPVGEIVVDAGVFFFQRDGQRENLLFSQRFKGSHRLLSGRLERGDSNSLTLKLHRSNPCRAAGGS